MHGQIGRDCMMCMNVMCVSYSGVRNIYFLSMAVQFLFYKGGNIWSRGGGVFTHVSKELRAN